MSKKLKTVIIVVFCVLLLATGGLIFGLKISKNKEVSQNAGNKTFTVIIQSDRDSFSKTDTVTSDDEFLGQYLRECGQCSYEETDYGIYIHGFYDYMDDMDNEYWWSITVNGESAVTGADEIVLKDGDEYRFELMKGF